MFTQSTVGERNIMNEAFEQLIERWRDGTLTPSEARELSDLLRIDEQARREFRSEAKLHGLLHCATAAEAMEAAAGDPQTRLSEPAANFARPRRATLRAVAAGLLIGVGFTSLAWAIAVPGLRGGGEIVSAIMAEDFSHAAPLGHGFPTRFDRWSGDPAEVVEHKGSGPALRFVQAETEANAPGGLAHWCDVFRLVDLRPLRKSLLEDSVLELETTFSVDRESEPHLFGARLFAFAGEPKTIAEQWPRVMQDALAIGAVQIRTDAPTAHGRRSLPGRTKIVVPPTADFVVIHLTVTPARTPTAEAAVAFAGHYADDVRLTLYQRRKP
jgi:hypothetical protein